MIIIAMQYIYCCRLIVVVSKLLLTLFSLVLVLLFIHSYELKWYSHQLGWHKANVHPALLKYLPDLLAKLEHSVSDENIRVFVPLCKKTLDMT